MRRLAARISAPCLAVAAASLAAGGALAGEEAFKPRKLSENETRELFAALKESASGPARAFRARIIRSEQSIFVLDAEPIRYEGEVWAERPAGFRQVMTKPRKSLAVANEKDLWIYFPESNEAQHVDLAKGLAGRSGTAMESFMPWITFDLEAIEKTYRVSVTTAEVPEGVTIRGLAPAREEGGDGKDAKAEAPPAARPEKAYRITYTPIDRKKSSGTKRLSIWVDGVNALPIRTEKATERGDMITTEFRDIVIERSLDKNLFEFTPPRGAKREELSG